MKKAPERTWIDWPNPTSAGLAFSCQARPPVQRTEYVRADMAAAEISSLRERVKELEGKREVDAGIMDGQKLVIKQLETERDGIRAAMAKEAAEQAVAMAKKWGDPNGTDYQQGGNDMANRIHGKILALAPLQAGYVCVPAQREFICKSCFLRSEEGRPEGDAPF